MGIGGSASPPDIELVANREVPSADDDNKEERDEGESGDEVEGEGKAEDDERS